MSSNDAVQESWLTLAGVRFRCWRGGSGLRLLCLHGAGGIGSLMPAVQALAAEGGVEVVAPEHPGFGLSDFPDWLDGVDDLVLFYRELAEHLGWSRFHLLGHSLGGRLAAEFAVHYAPRLQSLILVNAAGLHVPEAPMADVFGGTPEEQFRRLYYDPEAMLAKLPPPGPDDARIRTRNQIATARLAWERFDNPKLAHRLRFAQVPALVIWGREDRLIPPAHAEAWLAALPRGRLAWIEHCGHAPSSERTEEFVRIVRDFLRETEA